MKTRYFTKLGPKLAHKDDDQPAKGCFLHAARPSLTKDALEPFGSVERKREVPRESSAHYPILLACAASGRVRRRGKLEGSLAVAPLAMKNALNGRATWTTSRRKRVLLLGDLLLIFNHYTKKSRPPVIGKFPKRTDNCKMK